MWGKLRGLVGPYPLICHLVDTAMIAGALWDVYLSPGQRRTIAEGWAVDEQLARQLVMFWAGLHDTGKCTPPFQASAAGADVGLLREVGFEAATGWMHEGGPRHERASHLLLPQLLAELGYPSHDRPLRSVAHQVAQILGGHHGTYGVALCPVEAKDPAGTVPALGAAQGWVGQRRAHVRAVWEVCGSPAAPQQLAPPGACLEVTGLIVLADWLASNTRQIAGRLAMWDRDIVRHAAELRRRARWIVEHAGLVTPRWRSAATFAELFPHIRKPHALQADISSRLPELVDGPGMVLVTAPTGDGKTESALLAARLLGQVSGAPGLAVLLPTMATTTAMWRRVEAFTARQAVTATPVTLLHSMAWLTADYDPEQDEIVADGCVSTEATEWLRGRHRGLIAGVAVGTWDQAAMAALPLRFNVLRWLGLSGKTLIVDEAHSYDAYGHALTCRLLEWCGHLRIPVVVLSATLAGRTARQLTDAYRRGAGHTAPSSVVPAYPGWTHVSATTGEVTASPVLPTSRARDITVNTLPHRDQRGRTQQIVTALQPLADSGDGCAAVVCNTVATAQATRRAIQAAYPCVRTVLLHARMPAWQRDQITNLVEQWAGCGPDPANPQPRPAFPFVVVATQVIEQSLDVDFDVLLSDLAPIALPLQRVGRCHRHSRPHRPAWAREPVLHVLTPTGALPPREWGEVYDASLLRRTRDQLARLTGPIAIPGDVTQLIEEVYGAAFEQAILQADDSWRLATEQAMSAVADMAMIPPPQRVKDLHPLTDLTDPDLASTRLGADTIRVLPVHPTPDGLVYNTATGPEPLPARPDRDQTRSIIASTIQVHADWTRGRGPDTNPPTPWANTPALRDIALTPHGPANTPWTAPSGHRIHLHPDDGLIRER
ncbi:CRISPR-associated helicase Cas3' [Streptacidiphilus sp. MAP5-3]|uniref:CRISPR-associated helicase Cas3' n=1 Tax=unclassified Streptacidiphilus TaxID=2643834 RepID=UPI003517A487